VGRCSVEFVNRKLSTFALVVIVTIVIETLNDILKNVGFGYGG